MRKRTVEGVLGMEPPEPTLIRITDIRTGESHLARWSDFVRDNAGVATDETMAALRRGEARFFDGGSPDGRPRFKLEIES